MGSHFYQGTIVRSPSVETPPKAFRPLVKCAFDHHPAGMAELVDAPDSKSGVRKDVRVRVPFPVQKPYAPACVRLPQLSGRCPINRVERKLLTIGDRLQALRSDRADVVAELDELREIAVESESDATYYDEAIDRADARLTAGDVSRFERLLAKLDSETRPARTAQDPPSRQALTVSSLQSPVSSLRSERPYSAGPWTVDRGPWTVDRGPWTQVYRTVP